jgi:uncharacterized protein (DUF1919 family)
LDENTRWENRKESMNEQKSIQMYESEILNEEELKKLDIGNEIQ